MIHCATHCISCGLLCASHSRNPTGIRIFAVFHTASRSYLLPSKSHTVSYTRFARDDPVCVFEELIQDTLCHTLYKLRFCENCILRFLWPGAMVYLCQHISRSDYFSILFCFRFIFRFLLFFFSLFLLFPFYFFFSSLVFLMKAAFIIALQSLSCISYVPICSFIYASIAIAR